MPDKITPLILTFNEAPNIGRVLARLTWAERIVVIDSFSTDRTLDILKRYSQVQIFQRPFVSFADQCNFGLQKITAEWVLSLDADYILSDALIEEIEKAIQKQNFVGYKAKLRYCINGHPLRATLLPPRTVLYRRSAAIYHQEGHAHRVSVKGAIGFLDSFIYHDDRKPFRIWLENQVKYAKQESQMLQKTAWTQLSNADKIRKMVIFAPASVGLYCLFFKGLVFDGWRGWCYTFQRFLAESLLSYQLFKHCLYKAKLKRMDLL